MSLLPDDDIPWTDGGSLLGGGRPRAKDEYIETIDTGMEGRSISPTSLQLEYNPRAVIRGAGYNPKEFESHQNRAPRKARNKLMHPHNAAKFQSSNTPDSVASRESSMTAPWGANPLLSQRTLAVNCTPSSPQSQSQQQAFVTEPPASQGASLPSTGQSLQERSLMTQSPGPAARQRPLKDDIICRDDRPPMAGPSTMNRPSSGFPPTPSAYRMRSSGCNDTFAPPPPDPAQGGGLLLQSTASADRRLLAVALAEFRANSPLGRMGAEARPIHKVQSGSDPQRSERISEPVPVFSASSKCIGGVASTSSHVTASTGAPEPGTQSRAALHRSIDFARAVPPSGDVGSGLAASTLRPRPPSDARDVQTSRPSFSKARRPQAPQRTSVTATAIMPTPSLPAAKAATENGPAPPLPALPAANAGPAARPSSVSTVGHQRNASAPSCAMVLATNNPNTAFPPVPPPSSTSGAEPASASEDATADAGPMILTRALIDKAVGFRPLSPPPPSHEFDSNPPLDESDPGEEGERKAAVERKAMLIHSNLGTLSEGMMRGASGPGNGLPSPVVQGSASCDRIGAGQHSSSASAQANPWKRKQYRADGATVPSEPEAPAHPRLLASDDKHRPLSSPAGSEMIGIASLQQPSHDGSLRLSQRMGDDSSHNPQRETRTRALLKFFRCLREPKTHYM